MRTHVKKTASRCFAVLRQLRQIRRYVSTDTFQALVVALVVTRLDYGNAVLTGLPVYLSRRLQSVLNAAARLIFGLRRSDHVSDALISLHWLRIPQRIQFKMAVLTYKVLHGCAPSYLGPFVRVADLPSRRALRSANTSRLIQLSMYTMDRQTGQRNTIAPSGVSKKIYSCILCFRYSKSVRPLRSSVR